MFIWAIFNLSKYEYIPPSYFLCMHIFFHFSTSSEIQFLLQVLKKQQIFSLELNNVVNSCLT